MNPCRPALLVVDDTPHSQSLTAELFIDCRAQVTRLGHVALAMCTSCSPPHLLLLGVMMSDMDSFELAIRLGKDVRVSRIPIIFISTINDPIFRRRRGLELGAIHFETKPVEPAPFKSRVGNQF
ncbi:response regulator [Pseudomonas sp. OV226]|uniref:response regulator n=1 Tax=Pseudomonas sp. OV226 TaxID=2135588 RepID=UPI000D6D2053